MSEEKYITIEYVVFWLFRKTAEHINSTLFALKKELESTPEPISSPTIGFANPGGFMTSPSEIYWKGMNPLEYENKFKAHEEE